MGVIERVSVAQDRMSELWGVSVHDYRYLDQRVDLQDLLVNITQKRATAIENEVQPLEKIINRRNENLEKYGAVLQVLTTLQAKYDEDDDSRSTSISAFTQSVGTEEEFWAIMEECGYAEGSGSTLSLTKSTCEGCVSRCKSHIDEMNNDAQKDMTRLQSVVDRRDESYSTATSLMTSVSDTRSSLIKNL